MRCRGFFFPLLFLMMLAPAASHAQQEKLPLLDLIYVENNWPDATVTNSGIRTKVRVEGTGALAAAGDLVILQYTAKLLDGKVIASFNDDTTPVKFRLDRLEAVRCFETALPMMREGEQRVIIVPYELTRGYGQVGHIQKAPRNATIVYEIKLIKIERTK